MIESELRKNIRDSWPDIFREYVGFKKFISFDELETLSGVPLSTLHKISAGEHSPRWMYGMLIMAHLPPSAADMLMQPVGIATHPLAAGKACARATAADITGAAATMADALRDGFVDHKERADMLPVLKVAGEAIERFVAANPGVPHLGVVNSRDVPA